MVATRCIKCAKVLEHGGQFCDACKPDEPVIERGASSVVPLMTRCSICGRPFDAGTRICDCQAAIPKATQYGGFFVRLGAYVIDLVILSLFGGLVSAATSNPWNAFLVNLIAAAVYHVGFWVAEGATPGKMVLGLRVRSLDGSSLDLGQGVLRLIGYWFLGIGFIVMFFNEEKRCLHDYMANTVVVRER